jgi:hypothetical protein
MAYNSLFDEIKRREPWDSVKTSYTGTLADVIEGLDRALDEGDAVKLVLHPPRMIKAVMDHKIDNPDAECVEQLLRESIGLALGIYGGSSHRQDLARFRDAIKSSGNDELLTKRLEQKKDKLSWEASAPEKCAASAKELASEHARIYRAKDVLFIALAHGGVAAGLDTFLRYCDLAQSAGSSFYAVRFSKHKSHDKQPRLSGGEIDYLRSLSEGKQVVVFDEDSCEGGTLREAVWFFYGHVFPGRSINHRANINQYGISLHKVREKFTPLPDAYAREVYWSEVGMIP